MALFPLEAISRSNPKSSSSVFINNWLRAMSSTTNTFMFFNSVSNAVISLSDSAFAFVFWKLNVKLKTEPSSILLFTLMLPPCGSTNCLTMASPNPVPPYNLEVPLDACWKFSKIFSILFSAIPIPVSFTANSMVTFSSSSFNNRTLTVIFPMVVNFTALLTRFNMIWCNLTGSPTNTSGILLSYSFTNSKFFSWILVSNKWSIADMDDAILKGVCSKVIFPASTLARSSMSLISTINASPLILIAVKYSFCFAERSVFNTTLVNPIIAFIGVRISWLMFDKNCCFAFTASSAMRVALSALRFASSAISVANSAATFASINSFSILFWSVISLATTTMPRTLPCSSL